MSTGKLHDQIEAWRRDLIDFSRRNNLLNMSGRGTTVELVEPDMGTILASLVAGRGLTIRLPEPLSADETDEAQGAGGSSITPSRSIDRPLERLEVRAELRDRERLLSALRTLRRRSEQEFLDKGLAVLYLACGVLRWNDGEEDWSSPILLVPLRLD